MTQTTPEERLGHQLDAQISEHLEHKEHDEHRERLTELQAWPCATESGRTGNMLGVADDSIAHQERCGHKPMVQDSGQCNSTEAASHSPRTTKDSYQFSCEGQEVSLNVRQHCGGHCCRDAGSTVTTTGTMPDGLTGQLRSAKRARALLQEPRVHALGMEAMSTGQMPRAIAAMKSVKADSANGLIAAAGTLHLLHEWLTLPLTSAKLQQCPCSKVCPSKGDLREPKADSDRTCRLPLGSLGLKRPHRFPEAKKYAPVERVALRSAGSKRSLFCIIPAPLNHHTATALLALQPLLRWRQQHCHISSLHASIHHR
jgi:hypothetical protein